MKMVTFCFGSACIILLVVYFNSRCFKDQIMETVDEIKEQQALSAEKIASISADIDSLQTKVLALQQQIEDGEAVTKEDLQEILDAQKALNAQLGVVDAKEPVEAPVEPTP